MSQAGVERGFARPWTDRAFDAIPLAPIWVSTVLALALIGLFALTVYPTGEFADFMKQDIRWWEEPLESASAGSLSATILVACDSKTGSIYQP